MVFQKEDNFEFSAGNQSRSKVDTSRRSVTNLPSMSDLA